MLRFSIRSTLFIVAVSASCVAGMKAADSTSAPRPIPLTRPEMKQYLEDMKARTPRIPLPEMTEEEKAKYGDRGSMSYESRLRSLYMGRDDSRGGFFFGGAGTGGTRSNRSSTDKSNSTEKGVTSSTDKGGSGQSRSGGSFGRDSDPAMTLDYRFKTSLFWIASRTNNCQYCLGHQESKLLSAGMTEDEIAALDGDWHEFTPAEQAAFALARRITLEPHLITDADIERVRKHYTDLQILEMILSVAGNNSINRWKEGVGVPQSQGGGGFGRRTEGDAARVQESHSYLTPTSEKFLTKISLVAPVSMSASADQPTRDTVCRRPELESRRDVDQKLEAARHRKPRLPLVDEAKAREILAEDAPAQSIPQWMRLLANFSQSGKRNVSNIRSADQSGDLSPLLKAQVSWIIARQDRAWYAVGQAKKRLMESGQNEDQIYALDGNWASFSEKDRALFTVARKLAASPVVLTDDDVTSALKLAGPRDVVQLISYTTNRASFNRITEAAGLQID